MNGSIWSALPPIPLLGLGTASVESFQHYLLRMGATCGLSQTQLRALCPSDAGTPLSNSASSLARLPSIEGLTGNSDLRHGTLWLISGALHARTPRPGPRRWCPLCYAEWTEGVSREMLILELDICLVCPVHRCALVTQCPACGACQGSSTAYRKRHVCFRCGAGLGEAVVFPRLDAFETWLQAEAEALIELCATPGRRPIRPTNLTSFFSRLVEEASSSPQKQALKRLLHQGRRGKDDGRRTLQTLANLCAANGISLVDALVQPVEAASASLSLNWGPEDLPLERYRKHIWPKRTVCLLSGILALPDSFVPNPWILLGLLGIRWKETRGQYQEICRRYEHAYLSQAEATQLRSLNLGFSRVLRLQANVRKQGRRRSAKLEESVVMDLGFGHEIAKGVVKSATYVQRFVALGPQRAKLASGLNGA